MMLYEILAGEHPFGDISPVTLVMKHLQGPLPSLSEKRPDIPIEIHDILEKATAKQTGDRYPDAPSLAADFWQAFRSDVKARPVTEKARSKTPPPPVVSKPASTPEERNRSRMLEKVQTFWIEDVLENSLYGAALLELGMEYKADAVESPWELVLQQPDQPDHALPPDIRIADVFHEMSGELLILGEPGSRKTTTLLAYERTDLSASADVTHLLSQVWLLDLTQTPNATYPSYEEEHLFGHIPTWSADGSRIAFYNPDGHDPGIVIYDFAPEDDIPLRFIPSSYGAMGTVSPNGERIVFPTIIRRVEQMFTYLQFADLDQEALVSLTEADDPIDDVNAKWHPDGRHLAIARKCTDDRWTKGHQVYWLDSADSTIEPLVVDERYNTSSFTWNQDGLMLVMQRFPMLTDDGLTNHEATPEVWTYDMETGELTKITDNAFLPDWALP